MEQLYAIPEVKQRAGVSESTLRRLIRDGELLAYKVRGSIRIPESAIQDYLNKNLAA